MPCNHSQAQQSRRPGLVQELEERLRSVQAENRLLGSVVKEFQVERDTTAQRLLAAEQKQAAAEHAAAQDKQRADNLQHQLASAHQEQQRLKTSIKAQTSVLGRSRCMQDEVADVLLSLKQECEEKGSRLVAATKRIALLKDKLRHAERHLADAHHQKSCIEEVARVEACAHQQAAAGWRGEGERIRSALADARQQLQETHASHESSAAASEEAYRCLQVRQQALQAALAEHSLHSNACQGSLSQQLHSLQSELVAVKQDRDAAVTGLQALQMCHEKSRCSLHVGLSQVGDVRQQLVEAHRRCSEQQGTIVQLHAQLLASRQHLQAKEAEVLGRCSHQHAAREKNTAGLQAEALDSLQGDVPSDQVALHAGEGTGVADAYEEIAALGHLSAARDAEVSVMRSLQTELRRVHALERMCLNDVAEINTLHQQLHASQQSAWALRECILKFSMSDSSCTCTGHTGSALLPRLCPPCK